MAFMDVSEIERVLVRPLDHLCHNTITDPTLLREELARIRELGWAKSFEETNVGVWGLAVPIVSNRDDVICAVGIAGPSARLAQERIGDLIGRIHERANDIAGALGGRVLPVSLPAVPRARGR
jgi:DNA-binding IclR family transcriptional regulator